MALSIIAPYTPNWDLSGALSQARQIYASVQGDAAYPTGGYSVAPSNFGFGTRIIDILVSTTGVGNAGYQLFYDALNGTLRFFTPTNATSTLTEVASGTNLSAVVVNCAVFGW